MPLGNGCGDHLDLMKIQSHLPVNIGNIAGRRVGKENLGCRFGEHHIPDGRVDGIRNALRRHEESTVAFSEHLEPFSDFLLENGVAEHEPGFVENQECGLSAKGFFNTPEEIEKNRQSPSVPHAEDVFHFECGKRGKFQFVLFSIEKRSV